MKAVISLRWMSLGRDSLKSGFLLRIRLVWIWRENLKIFNANQEQLAQLSVEFSNHVLDDVKVKGVVVFSEEELHGTPTQVIDRCAQRGALLREAPAGDKVGGVD